MISAPTNSFSRRIFPKGNLAAICLLLASMMLSCNYGVIDLDVQGHRGCRGLMPENSIPAFEKAWELGVNTLEMDVVITKDRQVLVSHEAWFENDFCLDPAGNPVSESEGKQHNIYEMDFADVQKWDCGTKTNPRFPQQQKLSVTKPLLSDVFDAIESKVDYTDYDQPSRIPHYNIELKIEPNGVGVFHPEIPEFVELVLAVLQNKGVVERCTLQCFDPEGLREARRQDKTIALGLLIDEKEDYQAKISELGFYPEVLSPFWDLVDAQMLTFAAEKNMKVVPWTVNEEEDMRKLVRLGVHGMITDYPDRLLALLQEI
jgi:glycerophosphoryl diester phosphodiesterase